MMLAFVIITKYVLIIFFEDVGSNKGDDQSQKISIKTMSTYQLKYMIALQTLTLWF